MFQIIKNYFPKGSITSLNGGDGCIVSRRTRLYLYSAGKLILNCRSIVASTTLDSTKENKFPVDKRNKDLLVAVSQICCLNTLHPA